MNIVAVACQHAQDQHASVPEVRGDCLRYDVQAAQRILQRAEQGDNWAQYRGACGCALQVTPAIVPALRAALMAHRLDTRTEQVWRVEDYEYMTEGV